MADQIYVWYILTSWHLHARCPSHKFSTATHTSCLLVSCSWTISRFLHSKSCYEILLIFILHKFWAVVSYLLFPVYGPGLEFWLHSLYLPFVLVFSVAHQCFWIHWTVSQILIYWLRFWVKSTSSTLSQKAKSSLQYYN